MRACSRRMLLMAWAGALAGCERAPAPPRGRAVPAGATVLALGDSLTHGTGAPPEASFPAKLAQLSGWQVINAGVPGDTSAQVLQRLPALLAEHSPALVILCAGGNDLLRRMDEAALREHLRRAVRAVREAGAQVLLVAVPRPSVSGAALGSLTDHRLYGELAQELGVPLQRQGFAEVLSDERLRSDKLHPNAAGYGQFAQALAATAAATGLLDRRGAQR